MNGAFLALFECLDDHVCHNTESALLILPTLLRCREVSNLPYMPYALTKLKEWEKSPTVNYSGDLSHFMYMQLCV